MRQNIIRAGLWENASDLETEVEMVMREYLSTLPPDLGGGYWREADMIFSRSDGMFSARIPQKAADEKWDTSCVTAYCDRRRGIVEG
jgi:hypothetical protein